VSTYVTLLPIAARFWLFNRILSRIFSENIVWDPLFLEAGKNYVFLENETPFIDGIAGR
jgi:hypothetical protein